MLKCMIPRIHFHIMKKTLKNNSVSKNDWLNVEYKKKISYAAEDTKLQKKQQQDCSTLKGASF